MAKKAIPKISEDVSGWYNKVIQAADLADYGPAKGTMVIKPYGYAIWEQIQEVLNGFIKEKGVKNAYFPLFIPNSLLQKEAEHVEGFAPELAIVTHGGGEKLEEPLAIRPTSETIMYHMYSKWIQSYRDLPMMMNQWCNVVRWEKRTYMFMRTTEFLWQEGHTAHATHEEAVEMQKWAIDTYQRIFNDYLAMFGYVGSKSKSERFAGARDSLTFEALMPSGKALQSSTSHDLGQNFSKPFNIKFQDKDGKEKYVWQTSWGLSTRTIGGLLLAHGDDNGLRLPPRIAPIQVVLLPVDDDKKTIEYTSKLKDSLDSFRVEETSSVEGSIGYRINEWELKGVPIRIEIGPREVEAGELTLARRDTGDKEKIKIEDAKAKIGKLLEEIQENMFAQNKGFTQSNTFEAANYEEFKEIMEKHRGFVKVSWNDDEEAEDKIQSETKATSRCKIVGETAVGKDFFSGEESNSTWIFGQAY